MRYPLPYAFARSSQLLIEDDGQETVLWHSPQPDWSAITEVQRKHGLFEVRVKAHTGSILSRTMAF